MRKDNGLLDSTKHKLEKTVNQLRTQVAVLDQEIKDKDQVNESSIP